MKNLNNSTMIEIKYISPTNTRGSRVQLKTYDLRHRNNDKPSVKYIGFDYARSDITEMVLDFLKTQGKFEPIAANYNKPDCNVLLFKWNIEDLAKTFNVKLND